MTVLYLIVCAAALVSVLLSMKRDLMMLQQNSNRNDRYVKWLEKAGESTAVSRLCFMALGLMCMLKFMPHVVCMSCVGIASVWASALLATEKYKKPLVFTKRATRIYTVAILLVALCVASCLLIFGGDVEHLTYVAAAVLALSYAFSYWYVLASNWLLKPVEKRINQKYYDEAAAILASNPDLTVIGVTGSYGKTSTKHYLYRILSEQYDVLMTPGNFNTTLGVIRTIREHMKPYNQIFIAEMGAKQPNDIKEICDLVHPRIGIITAVGPQHLESFKTIERVQSTKFELADSLPSDGLVVVNDDFEFIANRPVSNVKCVRYAVDNTHAADFHATDIEYTPQGTHFSIANAEGVQIRLFTRLVGKCNVSNLMAAVIVALHMGVDKDKIRYAVEKIEQVEHRLSIKRLPSGITIIDDAYNSNPVGSSMALEVLGSMKDGKRIIITPGMIELGTDQYRLNKEFGSKIAESADVAFVVGEYNKNAISEGINAADRKIDVRFAPSFIEAHREMLTIAKPGDTVLFENDLPDTFK